VKLSSATDRNLTWHAHTVTRDERERLAHQRGCTLWFTGLSGSGKSTVANGVEDRLWQRGVRAYVLDGDNVRHGLNADLGFSPEDRKENIRRIGEVAKLFADASVVAITAFISPYQEDRDQVRSIHRKGDFIEVYVNCPLEECENRDPKGLYKKARAGQIPEFTGISDRYDAPAQPELELRTDLLVPEEAADQVVAYLEEHGYIPKL
jgi:adenylylsulfate kinase